MFAWRGGDFGSIRVLSDNPVVRSRKASQAMASDSVTWQIPSISTNVEPFGLIDNGGQSRRDVGAARPGDRYPLKMGGASSRDVGPAARRKWDVTWRRAANRVRATVCGGPVGVVKLLRARGGCLGVIRNSGVEGCEKSGGAAQRASNPEYPRRPGELKHLSTRRNRNQPRLPQ